ncbi:MAG: hypothetical protein NTX61_02190 [Bacteroidetes bacterium]|nr:hypothetical protein [Bacteroidota bacterium]
MLYRLIAHPDGLVSKYPSLALPFEGRGTFEQIQRFLYLYTKSHPPLQGEGRGGVLMIFHPDKVDDFPGEMQLVSKMKQIRTDIITWMLYDYPKCELLAFKAIQGFNINSGNYKILG